MVFGLFHRGCNCLFRKSQTSIEFLSTYTWTITSLLVVLGLLAYLGVFDINNYKVESCTLTQHLECLDAYLGTNGNFSVLIKNHYSKAILISEFNITNFDPDISVDPGVVIQPGESVVLSVVDNTKSFPRKKKEDFFFSVTYSRNPVGANNTVRGHAITEVQ